MRNQTCDNSDENHFTKYLLCLKEGEAIDYAGLEISNSSHIVRIELLLNNFNEKCRDHNNFSNHEKINLLTNISEAVGHLSYIYSNAIILCFENIIKEINNE